MKKVILIFSLFLISFNANAFYTTFDQDLTVLLKGLEKEYPNAKPMAIYVYVAKMEPMLKAEREKAYKSVIRACETDVDKFCSKNQQSSIDSVAKCISDNKSKVSFGCKRRIKEKFQVTQPASGFKLNLM